MLFRSTQDIKNIVGSIQKSTSWDTLKTYVSLAEQFVIIPIIGRDLYESLDVTDFDTLSPELKVLLIYVRKALAYSTLVRGLPELYATIADTGIHNQNPDNSTPAPQWVVNSLKEAFLSNADDCLNSLIRFLDENVADYPDWQDTEFVQKRSKLLIRSADELSNFIYFPNSYYAFWRMCSFFSIAERMYIIPAISEEFLAEIKANENPNIQEKKAIQRAKEALAHLAFFESIPALQFKNTGTGLLITSYSDGIVVKSNDYKMIADLREKVKENGKGFLSDLKSFLDENANDFPTYKNSDKYKETESRITSYGRADNSQTIISI